jgi:hypothetical protein
MVGITNKKSQPSFVHTDKPMIASNDTIKGKNLRARVLDKIISSSDCAFDFLISMTEVWEVPKLTKIEANTEKETTIKYFPNFSLSP